MMSSEQIAAQRLHNQHIEGAKFQTPADVVRWMGAIQAQDYGQSLWAIGARIQDATVKAVEAAIEAGTIIRTWPMRGTIHWVAPEDAQWMLKLCASRLIAADARRLEQLELSTAIMARCETLVGEALSGGKRLARPEMMQLFEDHQISTHSQRGYHILWYLAQSGVICIGPMAGKQQTFMLLDEWVSHSRELSGEDALSELAQRYFTSHAPATVQDFARWTGLTVTAARQGIQAAQPALIAESINGFEYWLNPATQPAPEAAATHLHLLPGFDEYIIGYGNRDAVLAPEHLIKIIPGKNGVFFPIIVKQGQVIGTWKVKRRAKAFDLTLDPFLPAPDLEALALEASQAYSRFIELPLASVRVNTSA